MTLGAQGQIWMFVVITSDTAQLTGPGSSSLIPQSFVFHYIMRINCRGTKMAGSSPQILYHGFFFIIGQKFQWMFDSHKEELFKISNVLHRWDNSATNYLSLKQRHKAEWPLGGSVGHDHYDYYPH